MPRYLEHQNAFNAGELSPTMLGRADIAAYAAGLRTCENFIVLRPGGAERRMGSVFTTELVDSTKKGRLMRFRFSELEAYILVFEECGVTIIKDGGVVAYGTQSLQTTTACDLATEEIEVPLAHGWPTGLLVHCAAVDEGVLPTGLTAATNYFVQKPLTYVCDQSTGVDFAPGQDTIDIGEHDLVVGMGPFRLKSTGIIPPGLSYDQDYYIQKAGATKVGLEETIGGGLVDITGTGSGMLTLYPTAEYRRTKFRLRDGTGTLVDLSATGSGVFTVGPPTPVPYIMTADWGYLQGDLFLIQSTQDKDALYLARRDHPLRRIVRYSDYAWEIADADLTDGPYLDVAYYYPDQDEAGETLAPAALTGKNVTVTASKALFRGSDVGRWMRIDEDGNPDRWGWAKIVEVAGSYFNDLDIVSYPVTDVASGSDQMRAWQHLFINGEGPVHTDRTTRGLTLGTNYYLHDHGSYWFSFHLTYAEAIADENRVDLTAVGSLPNITSSRITILTHGFADGDGPVTLTSSGLLPTGYSGSLEYYVNRIDDDNLSLSLEIGGLAIAVDFPNGSGVHTIIGGTGATTICKVNIESDFPQVAAQEGWRLGAFGTADKLGHPEAVTMHEQRLILSGAFGTPQTIYASVTGKQLLFSPDDRNIEDAEETARHLVATSGYTFKLVSEDLNTITWLRPVRALLCGGLGGIFYVTGTTFSESISPTNVNAKRGTTTGAATPSPVVLGSSVIFVDESGKMVSRAQVEPSSEAIEVDELMAMADHLSQHGLLDQIAASETPLPVIWVVQRDGSLLSLTFDPKQNVAAWARHNFGGPDAIVESVATLPDAQGGQVYVIVSRTIGGTTKRWVEYLAPRLGEFGDDLLYHGLDAGPLAYDGSPTDTISQGLDHFEGETVRVIADGGNAGDHIVTGGSITIGYEASKWVIGFPFRGVLGLLPLEIPQATGQAIVNRTVRSVKASVRVNRTRGLSIGPNLDHLTEIDFRHISDLMDTAPPLFTGVKEHALQMGFEHDGSYIIVSEEGMPCQILSVLTTLEFEQ